MQHQIHRPMGELEEELRRTKEKLNVGLVEKGAALDQLRGAKDMSREANMGVKDGLTPNKAKELSMNLENLKKLLSGSQDELKMKDKKIESLELELRKATQFEEMVALKDAALDKLTEEVKIVREKEQNTMVLLSENQDRIQELEATVESEKQSKSKLLDSLAIQTKLLEATKVQLEESKTESTSLRREIESLQELAKQRSRNDNGEKEASLKDKGHLEEMELLKNELKQAIESEEKSNKAMEDLALALKEVATEGNHAKEKASIAQIELEHVKEEVEQLKAMVRSNDEKHQKLLEEAKKEAELHRNTADRLRLEAEEALLAWNGKEIGFVSCIKRVEEERAIAQHESSKLADSLKAAENMTRTAREETYRLRDILKQAVNEANAAKAASGIARDENAQLKDCLAEKEETLHFLTRENERLRMNEAAAHENLKEYKSLLSSASTEFKSINKVQTAIPRSPDYSTDEERQNTSMKKAFSFDLEDLKFMNEPEDAHDEKVDEDPEKAEALKGSIFDTNAETPKSELHTPKSAPLHQRGHSSPFTGGGTPKDQEFDHINGVHYDSDTDRHSHRRVKTMFRRVGDLLMINKKAPH